MCIRDSQGLAYNIRHRHPGVEGSVGVLKNHLHPFAVGHKFLGTQMRNILAVIADGAVGGVVEADNGCLLYTSMVWGGKEKERSHSSIKGLEKLAGQVAGQLVDVYKRQGLE